MVDKIKLNGGALCLDFCNTIKDRTVTPPHDYLHGFDDLLDWLLLTKSYPKDVIENLRKNSGRHAPEASHVFTLAMETRELLFEIFSSLSDSRKPTEKSITTLNGLISETMQHKQVEFLQGKFHAGWRSPETDLKSVLWPIINSSQDLLLTGDFKRFRECPRCLWLFYDTSKNGRRRWCSMETCGSNDKSLRYYYRKKEEQ